MKRADDFETRRQHLRAMSDEELKAYFWKLAQQTVDPLLEYGRTHTTPSVERSVLLRMGFSSLEAKPIVEGAIAHYQTLPASGQKALGITDGFHVLELVQCLPPYPDDAEGETVWTSDYHTLTLWKERPESAAAACCKTRCPQAGTKQSVLSMSGSCTKARRN